jgi:hypothetical protein
MTALECLPMAFLEVNVVVEIEVRKTEPGTAQTDTTNLDVNEIIGKVRNFVDSMRNISSSGEPMAVSVDGFNFSVGKVGDEYDLTVKLNLTFKPKSSAD